MKKQILILTFLSLAFVFAGINEVFGQDQNYPDGESKTPAVDLDCAADFGHLNPNPGQLYTYEIGTDPATVGSVHWFVTDESDVIYLDGGVPTLQPNRDADDGAGSYILDAEDGVYDNAANLQKTIDITWQYFDPANEVLLVAYVTGADGCSDNVEVWRIEPSFSFTLDVLAMEDDGDLETAGGFEDECVSPVFEAIYDGTYLTMDYGTNYVYFSVTAANFVDSWMPAMSAVISTNATVTAVEWAYPDQAILGDATGATGTWYDVSSATPQAVEASTADGVVGADGEHIIVRVQIDHGSEEAPLGTTAATVTLTVNGVMYDAAGDNYTNDDLRDVDEVGGVCVQTEDDVAVHNLLPRPDISEVTPDNTDGPFEPKN